ncbi:MAG: O-antigen ligase family protein [Pseudomonadales bacterium]|jgi:O-antigen ligase|nr:O-antigen ligase family protein [Pseudomonadales bacterium]
MHAQSIKGNAFFRDRITWLAILIVCCFVAVLLLPSQSRASYPTYILAIVMLVSFASWRDVFQLPLVRWIVALLVWLCLSVFWSEPFVLREAISVWTRSILILAFVVAAAECQLRGQLQRWMSTALTWVGCLAVLASLINFFVTDPADGRLNGLGQLDTHVIAALVYGTMVLFVWRAAQSTSNTLLRLAALAVALLMIWAVFLSDSRNAWVSLVIGLAVFGVAQWCKDVRQFLTAVISVGVLGGVVLLILITSETTRELLLPRGDSFRIAIWTETFNAVVRDSLLFGRGILTSDDISIGAMNFFHPHNMYLALLHQGGIVALVLFGAVIVLTLMQLLRNYDSLEAKLMLGVLALALSAYLLDGHELVDKVGDTWLLFWFPVGIALGFGWRIRDSVD